MVWDALGEYQLNRDTDHSEPEVLTSFILLVAVKHNDHEVAERIARDDNGARSWECATPVSFAAKFRSAAESLSSELSSNKRARTPTLMSLFDWAARDGRHSVAAALLHRIGVVTTEQDTISWWYSWNNVVYSKNINVMMFFVFERRIDANIRKTLKGEGLLLSVARGGWAAGVDVLLEAGATVDISAAL